MFSKISILEVAQILRVQHRWMSAIVTSLTHYMIHGSSTTIDSDLEPSTVACSLNSINLQLLQQVSVAGLILVTNTPTAVNSKQAA